MCPHEQWGIVRKALAVALALSIQTAAVTAPLVHAHPEEQATDHHHGRMVHMHWAGHDQGHRASGAPQLEAADHDRAVSITAIVAVSGSWFPAPSLTRGVFALFRPAEAGPYRAVQVVRSHDPPRCQSLSSRAPPSLLS